MAAGNFDGASFDSSIGGFDVDEVIQGGGYEIANLGPRRRTREEVRRERIEYGVVQEVAARQAADYELDDRQRLEELQGELKIRGIEMRSAHLEALNAQREKILREELQHLFRQRQDAEDTAVLLFLAGSA